MNIDISSGTISFAGGTVERKADRTKFLSKGLGRDAKVGLINEDWRHYGIRPEPGVAANLVFKGDCLHQVWILMTIPSDESDEWTTESELQRKLLHDNWLLAKFGKPPYEQGWGKISSEFDAKGCVSEIIITYAD